MATIELFTTSKPERPKRALVFSIVLLAVSSMLAAGMSWTRSAQLLAPRVRSTALGVSFRPPRGFSEGDVVSTRRGPAHPYHMTLPNGGKILLVFQRIEVGPDDDATEVCKRLLADHGERIPIWAAPFVRRTIRGSKRELGGLEAIEAVDEKSNTIVRAALLGEGFAIAVVLNVEGAELGESSYRLFDRTCETLKIEKSDDQRETAVHPIRLFEHDNRRSSLPCVRLCRIEAPAESSSQFDPMALEFPSSTSEARPSRGIKKSV